MPAISFKSVSKSYPSPRGPKGSHFLALDQVSLDILEGEFFGLLGPNGAGKTTMVRILSTLLKPTAGHAEVAGFDVVKQANQVRRMIGVTGQYAAVDEYLTGRENLRMFGDLFHLTPAYVKARSAELLASFDLEDAADRPARTYSGGMRRRLDLAASLIARPEILFLDEPTGALDEKTGRQVLDVITKLQSEQGFTMIMVTHNINIAEMANTVIKVSDGKIAEVYKNDVRKSAFEIGW